MQGSAGVSKALSLLMGANVKVRRLGIGLQEEEMGHQMKNIGRSKKGMLYDSMRRLHSLVAQPHSHNGAAAQLR